MPRTWASSACWLGVEVGCQGSESFAVALVVDVDDVEAFDDAEDAEDALAAIAASLA